MDRQSRTGIRERRIAADDETTTTLSVNAARDALAVAGVDASEVDLVIVGTCSPDYPLPATAVLVATELGATRAAGFDLQAACSGFLYALATGDAFIRSGMYRQVLVIGVEVLSRFLDWSDRSTCVLFGDGVGSGPALGLRPARRAAGLGAVQRWRRLRGDHRAGRGQRATGVSRDGGRAAAHHPHAGQRGLQVRHPADG